MNFDIKTLASMATLLTSIVGVGTLLNSTKQRLTANRPDIYVKNDVFEMIIAQAKELPKIKHSKESKEFSLPIYNVGLGTAKKLKIKWEIETDFIEKVKTLDINNEYLIEDSEKLSEGFDLFNIRSGNLSRGINLKHDLVQRIDFLLPYKSDKDTNELLKIPRSITLLFGCYVELCCKHNKLNELKDIFFILM
ncbi:hypothetical protein RB298_25565 [Priestia sp. BR_2]